MTVYISIDRFVSIKYPSKRFFLRNKKNQLLFFLLILTFNIIYYLPVVFSYDINEYNNSSVCEFINLKLVTIISYMDLTVRVVIPFGLMAIFTLFLSYSIFKSRSRIIENFLNRKETQTYYREIRLALSSIVLNLVYILTQLPISVTVFYSINKTDLFYNFTYYIFYLCYGLNFYAILGTNSLFRKTFIKMILK